MDFINTKTQNPIRREGYHQKKDLIGPFTEEQINIINGVQKRMDLAFCKFVIDKKWTNTKVADEFAPYISSNAAVSKILCGKQHVNLATILVLALRFGHSLDEMLLGKRQTGYTLTPDDVSYLDGLVKKASKCSDSNT